MLLLSIYDLTEAWQTEEIILPLFFDRKDIPFHMVTYPKCIIQCGVPGCFDVIRLSEMVVHNRDNARKHLDLCHWRAGKGMVSKGSKNIASNDGKLIYISYSV